MSIYYEKRIKEDGTVILEPHIKDSDYGRRMLADGARPEVVFAETREWLELIAEGWPDETREWLSLIVRAGLSKAIVAKWAEETKFDCMICDFVSDEHAQEWRELGVRPEKFITKWLEYVGWLYFYGGETLSDFLPKLVTTERFVEHFGLQEIVRLQDAVGFNYFIEDYLERGGELETLKDKFLSEVGYSTGEAAFRALIDLILAGAKVELDIVAGLIEIMDPSCEDRIDYAQILREAGASEKLVNEVLG